MLLPLSQFLQFKASLQVKRSSPLVARRPPIFIFDQVLPLSSLTMIAINTATESSVDTTITSSSISSLSGSSSPTEVVIIDPSTSGPNPAGIAVGLYSICVTAFYTLGETWVLVTTSVSSPTEVGIIDPSTSTSRPNPAGIAVGLYSICVTAFYTLGEKWVLVTSAVTGTIITAVLIGFFFLIVLFKKY